MYVMYAKVVSDKLQFSSGYKYVLVAFKCGQRYAAVVLSC